MVIRNNHGLITRVGYVHVFDNAGIQKVDYISLSNPNHPHRWIYAKLVHHGVDIGRVNLSMR